jgi:IS5 family transposase
MIKALLLQQWYGLSDPGLEEALLDRVSFRRFCGLSLEEATPDETTLCRFRLALAQAGLGEALFTEISRQLETAGYLVKAGTLIDASLVEAAVRRPRDGSTPKGQESRSAHDPDANWTRTGKSRRV